jgi:hypothetical protein
MKKVSKVLLLFVVGTTFVQTVLNLDTEFSKMILVLLFFYLLLSYYLIQFYSMDLDESFYNPRFDDKNLFDPMLTRIKCEIVQRGLNVEADYDVMAEGFFTNWSEEGCYIFLEKSVLLKGDLSLVIEMNGLKFYQDVSIVSKIKNGSGYGLRFIPVEKRQIKNHLGWKEFYEIIEEMGYTPELLV